ncbi:MAG: hypothetical protein ILO10_08680 [Kiritimatiellae bacterium]|nr:hypothetical protein [Kiritimatiellia bacterium]
MTLTGWLVSEDDWPLYEAAREEVERRQVEAFRPMFPEMRGTNGSITNGLRFTDISVDTNGDYRLGFAWDTDGDVQVFCRSMHYECWTNFGVVSTNDENEVVTNDVVNWRQVPGEKFRGIPDYWVSLGVTNVMNGEGSFTDTDHSDPLFDRVRFYAAAQYADSDDDGITDGEEWLWGVSSQTDDSDGDGVPDYLERTVYHTDPYNPDTDGDGWTDGEEVTAGTDPLDRLSATRLARGVLVHGVKYSSDATNQWVQLHCSGPRGVDVGGFRLQAAGTNWETQVVLPEGTWMVPGHFLLVGGEGVTNADVTAEWTLAGTISNAPTAGVRLLPPEETTNGPVDVVLYAKNTGFNEYGLDTTGWLSQTTNLWASSSRHLERLNLGGDSDLESDWRQADDGIVFNTSIVLDSDGDGLADEQEYMLGSNPFAQDSDGDGLLDGFEAAHGLDPTNGDTDGDGTPDGEEHDGNGGLYFWAQFADGVAVTAVTPSKAGWQRGESIGRNGTVRFDFDNLDGVALWATFEDGGYQREPFTLTATHATIRYESELELVEWPLWRKTALIVPDDGAETFSVTVADE